MIFRQATLLLLVALAAAAPSSDNNHQKIEPKLQASLRNRSPVNIFIKFNGGSGSVIRRSQSLRFGDRIQKINHLVSSLKSATESSQSNVLNLLRRSPRHLNGAASFKQFWVSNELYVKGATAGLVDQLAGLPEVTEIREERVFQLEGVSEAVGGAARQEDYEWNVGKVEAPEAWRMPGGNNGSGIVIAVTDSGVRHTHEALRNNYRESYGWFDPFEGTDSPVDTHGHGTHCIGSAVGAKIGVAPGAQWIACRGCRSGACMEAQLKACGQWTLCPTLPDGSAEDCSKAPRISTNSWGGGAGSDFYNDVIDAWKAADIIPVFAAGNGMRSCSSVVSPGDQDVIAVGATGPTDLLWEYSLMGPSVQGVLKPDISAPGHQIRSSWFTNDTAYIVDSGTSMATPHVAGAIAILLSQNPSLKYPEVKALLERTADRNLPDTEYVCGEIPSTQFPNHQYGHGRLNVRKVLEASLNRTTTNNQQF